ncbi:MAG: helix-turn-helix transcriptional regulator [Prevotellaceae bacterium]|jgi:transcriptional regulator with XRE-family HTH domain|nr:helix-turn-helix transcriptional regulator [Prevotellaceae bacterium]
MDLGYKLLELRRRSNYSQKQVAELLEVSQSTYCDWESNTSKPKINNIVKIAQLYNLDINELIDSNLNVNIVNSPNTISNSPNSKVETPEALIRLAEGLDRLTMLIEKLVENYKKYIFSFSKTERPALVWKYLLLEPATERLLL